jgi:hypothetical protein
MQAVTTIGLDIAKSVFQVHGVAASLHQHCHGDPQQQRQTPCLIAMDRPPHPITSKGAQAVTGLSLEAGAKSEARASLVCLIDRLSTRSAPPSRSRSQSTSATVSPRRTAPELRTSPQTPTQANWPHF